MAKGKQKGNTYVVGSGDSWESIAGSVFGNQRMFVELMRANPGIGMLHTGMVINLPKAKANSDIVVPTGLTTIGSGGNMDVYFADTFTPEGNQISNGVVSLAPGQLPPGTAPGAILAGTPGGQLPAPLAGAGQQGPPVAPTPTPTNPIIPGISPLKMNMEERLASQQEQQAYTPSPNLVQNALGAFGLQQQGQFPNNPMGTPLAPQSVTGGYTPSPNLVQNALGAFGLQQPGQFGQSQQPLSIQGQLPQPWRQTGNAETASPIPGTPATQAHPNAGPDDLATGIVNLNNALAAGTEPMLSDSQAIALVSAGLLDPKALISIASGSQGSNTSDLRIVGWLDYYDQNNNRHGGGGGRRQPPPDRIRQDKFRQSFVGGGAYMGLVNWRI